MQGETIAIVIVNACESDDSVYEEAYKIDLGLERGFGVLK